MDRLSQADKVIVGLREQINSMIEAQKKTQADANAAEKVLRDANANLTGQVN